MPQEAPKREHQERIHGRGEVPEEIEMEQLHDELPREAAPAPAYALAAAPQQQPGGAPQGEDEPMPFPDYRRRTAEELVKRVRQLPGEKLADLEQYERAHKGRKTIIEAVRRRREQLAP